MAEIIVSILLFFMRVSVEKSLLVGGVIGFGSLFYSLYYIDGKIEEKFADKNEKR